MSKRSPKLYLEDIIQSISRIDEYIEDLSFEDFSKDWKTIDAVVRNLEIIGEAARNIPQEVIEEQSSIPWHFMVSMRNKVVHEYFGVDVDILWKTIKEDLPKLRKQIRDLV